MFLFSPLSESNTSFLAPPPIHRSNSNSNLQASNKPAANMSAADQSTRILSQFVSDMSASPDSSR